MIHRLEYSIVEPKYFNAIAMYRFSCDDPDPKTCVIEWYRFSVFFHFTIEGPVYNISNFSLLYHLEAHVQGTV